MEKNEKSKEQVVDMIKSLKFKKLNAMRNCNHRTAEEYESVMQRLIKSITNFDDMLSELA